MAKLLTTYVSVVNTESEKTIIYIYNVFVMPSKTTSNASYLNLTLQM